MRGCVGGRVERASIRSGRRRVDARVSARVGRRDVDVGEASRGVALALTTLALSALAGASRAEFYIEDVPQGLDAREGRPRERLGALTRGARGKEVQACATKCLATCVRGGSGAPGLGPASVRRDPIAFKNGFRSREYCLTECTEICARALGR